MHVVCVCVCVCVYGVCVCTSIECVWIIENPLQSSYGVCVCARVCVYVCLTIYAVYAS